MNKALKGIGKVLLVLLILIVLFLTVVFIVHRVMLKKEAPLLEKPLGQMVEVDGHDMCVYTEGSGGKCHSFQNCFHEFVFIK